MYCIFISGYKIMEMYEDTIERIEKHKDFSKLNELHNIICGAKALHTEGPMKTIEGCRLACGGHGFSHYSGIPNVIEEYKPYPTLEGENTVMYL